MINNCACKEQIYIKETEEKLLSQNRMKIFRPENFHFPQTKRDTVFE
jgi:hypothetical protein